MSRSPSRSSSLRSASPCCGSRHSRLDVRRASPPSVGRQRELQYPLRPAEPNCHAGKPVRPGPSQSCRRANPGIRIAIRNRDRSSSWMAQPLRCVIVASERTRKLERPTAASSRKRTESDARFARQPWRTVRDLARRTAKAAGCPSRLLMLRTTTRRYGMQRSLATSTHRNASWRDTSTTGTRATSSARHSVKSTYPLPDSSFSPHSSRADWGLVHRLAGTFGRQSWDADRGISHTDRPIRRRCTR